MARYVLRQLCARGSSEHVRRNVSFIPREAVVEDAVDNRLLIRRELAPLHVGQIYQGAWTKFSDDLIGDASRDLGACSLADHASFEVHKDFICPRRVRPMLESALESFGAELLDDSASETLTTIGTHSVARKLRLHQGDAFLNAQVFGS
jgi:hypothetical protein